jgi:hypothetical protein
VVRLTIPTMSKHRISEWQACQGPRLQRQKPVITHLDDHQVSGGVDTPGKRGGGHQDLQREDNIQRPSNEPSPQD